MSKVNEAIPKGTVVMHHSTINGQPGRHDGKFVVIESIEDIIDGEDKRFKYSLFEPLSDVRFKCENAAPRHKLEVLVSKNKNLPPRTLPALMAVILMNRLGHKPKSVIIQTDTEVVVQVRGDFDHLVKRLKKTFKSKGKDESGGVLRVYAWKLRGLGLMNVYQNVNNDFMSVRFFSNPELGVRKKSEAEVEAELVSADAAAKTTAQHLEAMKTMQAGVSIPANHVGPVPDDLESIDITG